MRDLFGKALYNYWKGDRKTPYILRRDDNYTNKSSLKIYFTKRLYHTEKKILHHGKGKILDVGCGAGRHILYFQKRGYDIAGIDSSQFAIRVCKERGCKKVQVMDINNSKFPPHTFDTILLFGHNIGIGGTLSGVKRLLLNLKKIIRTDGVLLLTSHDITKSGKNIHTKHCEKNIKSGQYRGEIKIRLEYKDQVGEWFQWLHIDPITLKKIAKEAGWKVIEICKENSGEYSAALNLH